MRAVDARELKPSQLILSNSLSYLVEEALASCGKGAWAKDRRCLQASSGSDMATISTGEVGQSDDGQLAVDALYDETSYVLVIDKSFLAFVPCSLPAASVVQSTTEANPRREPTYAQADERVREPVWNPRRRVQKEF